MTLVYATQEHLNGVDVNLGVLDPIGHQLIGSLNCWVTFGSTEEDHRYHWQGLLNLNDRVTIHCPDFWNFLVARGADVTNASFGKYCLHPTAAAIRLTGGH